MREGFDLELIQGPAVPKFQSENWNFSALILIMTSSNSIDKLGNWCVADATSEDLLIELVPILLQKFPNQTLFETSKQEIKLILISKLPTMV